MVRGQRFQDSLCDSTLPCGFKAVYDNVLARGGSGLCTIANQRLSLGLSFGKGFLQRAKLLKSGSVGPDMDTESILRKS